MKKTKQTRSPSSSDDAVTEYAQSVVDGVRVAGPDVRAQCARHLADLAEGAKRGLVWNLAESNKAQRFYRNVLKLNGGDFEGVPFELLPWQKFVVGSLFGWHGDDGYRRFRVAYVETAKGSGKSPLAAGIGMKGLVADGEPRAEIYSAATKKDQAMILFRDAVAMCDQSPELTKRITKSGTGEKAWNMAYLAQGAFFRPISSDDGQSGPRPHIALVDELHEHRTNTVVEMLRAGTKSRRQAMIFMITNAGSGRNGPC
ncbi:terminase large subunit, partial [Massilia sp. CCM 8734]|uniref:terminase large subunit domain-containing protein n=1 Tax=Massilia sp. CCM 8734 TaxID=2609283 RepID=UPI0016B63F63